MISVFYSEIGLREACKSDPHIKETIRRIIERDFSHGTNNERLYCKPPIWTCRVNQGARVYYTYHYQLRDKQGQPIPVVLDYDPDHKYKSKYMDQDVYNEFFARKLTYFINALNEQGSKSTDTLPSKIENRRIKIIGKAVIELDDDQSSIQAPAVIEGIAGSGKTCVAFTLLEEYVESQEQGTILYVTKSPKLANEIKRLWSMSPLSKINPKVEVKISTYDDLLVKLFDGLKLQFNAREAAITWMKNTQGIIGQKYKSEKSKNERAELLYQEFRIISGFDEMIKYRDGGKNISDFQKDMRSEIYAKFHDWMSDNNKNKVFYPEFMNIDIKAFYDLILVDEAQDLSHNQLKSLMKLAKQQKILYSLDPKQNLSDVNPKTVYLQGLFFEQHGLEIKVKHLSRSYRCPPNIMKLAEEFNKVRTSLLPLTKQGAGFLIPTEDVHEPGEISWIGPWTQASESHALGRVDDLETCIICSEEDKKFFVDKEFVNVFTVEEIKGLQFKTVIIYQPLKRDSYRKINAALGLLKENGTLNPDENTIFGPELCLLFTAATRAQSQLWIYQESNSQLEHLIDIYRKAHTNIPVEIDEIKLDLNQAVLRAKEYLSKGLIEQASNLLKVKIYKGQDKINDKVASFIAQWAIDESKRMFEESATDQSYETHGEQTIEEIKLLLRQYAYPNESNKESAINTLLKEWGYREKNIQTASRAVTRELFKEIIESNNLIHYIDLLSKDEVVSGIVQDKELVASLFSKMENFDLEKGLVFFKKLAHSFKQLYQQKNEIFVMHLTKALLMKLLYLSRDNKTEEIKRLRDSLIEMAKNHLTPTTSVDSVLFFNAAKYCEHTFITIIKATCEDLTSNIKFYFDQEDKDIFFSIVLQAFLKMSPRVLDETMIRAFHAILNYFKMINKPNCYIVAVKLVNVLERERSNFYVAQQLYSLIEECVEYHSPEITCHIGNWYFDQIDLKFITAKDNDVLNKAEHYFSLSLKALMVNGADSEEKKDTIENLNTMLNQIKTYREVFSLRGVANNQLAPSTNASAKPVNPHAKLFNDLKKILKDSKQVSELLKDERIFEEKVRSICSLPITSAVMLVQLLVEQLKKQLANDRDIAHKINILSYLFINSDSLKKSPNVVTHVQNLVDCVRSHYCPTTVAELEYLFHISSHSNEFLSCLMAGPRFDFQVIASYIGDSKIISTFSLKCFRILFNLSNQEVVGDTHVAMEKIFNFFHTNGDESIASISGRMDGYKFGYGPVNDLTAKLVATYTFFDVNHGNLPKTYATDLAFNFSKALKERMKTAGLMIPELSVPTETDVARWSNFRYHALKNELQALLKTSDFNLKREYEAAFAVDCRVRFLDFLWKFFSYEASNLVDGEFKNHYDEYIKLLYEPVNKDYFIGASHHFLKNIQSFGSKTILSSVATGCERLASPLLPLPYKYSADFHLFIAKGTNNYKLAVGSLRMAKERYKLALKEVRNHPYTSSLRNECISACEEIDLFEKRRIFSVMLSDFEKGSYTDLFDIQLLMNAILTDDNYRFIAKILNKKEEVYGKLNWSHQETETRLDALMIVCHLRPEGYRDTIRKLIVDKKVNLGSQSLEGWTAFSYALLFCCEKEVIKNFVNSPDFDLVTSLTVTKNALNQKPRILHNLIHTESVLALFSRSSQEELLAMPELTEPLRIKLQAYMNKAELAQRPKGK